MRDVKIALEELKDESDSGTLSLHAVIPRPERPRRRRWILAVAAGAVAIALLVWAAASLRAPRATPTDEVAGEGSAADLLPGGTTGIELAAGTKVGLVLLEDLSLVAAKPGDRVALKVARDVTSGGVVVIARGAEASATIADADKKTLFRRTPKLTLRMSYVKAVDGEKVRIRASAAAPAAPTGDVVEVAVRERVARQGSELAAYLDEVKVLAH
jgi:ferric-dicitrate binding protein FerR (iron transport regulator)